MRIVVTGASGFVGVRLCEDLVARGHQVRATIRSSEAARRLPEGVEPVSVADLGPDTDWVVALRGAEAVVHAAGLAHVMGGAPADAYERANAQGTARLAREASRAGLTRFVYLSSVKVHGEGSGERPLEATDPLRPADAYAASKVRAEESLLAEHAQGRLSVAIVRPPLVYGPGVKANFRRMMEMVARGVPLPLGSVRNQRSLISVWNLCDLVATLLLSPKAGGRAWLASDHEDVSTPELLRRLGDVMGRPARVFPFPLPALRAVLGLVGMGSEFQRLTESLRVNVEPALREPGMGSTLDTDAGAGKDGRIVGTVLSPCNGCIGPRQGQGGITHLVRPGTFMEPRDHRRAVQVVHVSTVLESLRFLSGQVRYLRDHGFSAHLVCAPAPCSPSLPTPRAPNGLAFRWSD